MNTRYNIYFEGQHLEGFDPAQVRTNLAKLFKANEKTLERLFSGSPQLLKKDCDEQTARKYELAMQRAGAVAVLRALNSGAEDAVASAPESPASGAGTRKKLNAAERIAALAAADADPRFRTMDDEEEEQAPREVEWTSPLDSEGKLALAPAGTKVLQEDERPAPVQVDVDTSALHIDAPVDRLSAERPPEPPAPDTSHMAMGDVGEVIPTLPREGKPLDPDTSGIDLSPEGTDFADCTPPEPEAPDLDLSTMEVAPQGSDVLEEKYRPKQTAEAPSTDHLSIQNPN